MLFQEGRERLTLWERELEYSSYQELKAAAKSCTQCRLREDCRQVVFGVGHTKTPLLLVGEGPGEDEDLQGEPFVGRAGKLLDRILEAAEIKRDAIYITNVVKCRPKGNRTPTVAEIKECLPYLYWEIQLIQPSIIVPLGATAFKGLLDPEGSIMKSRGQWVRKKTYSFLPTYHPAALLRDPSKKKPVWEDFLQIKKAYEKSLNKEQGGKEEPLTLW